MLLKSRIFFAQLVILAIIAVVHILAIQNDWYWYYVWLDVPVHFLAGIWVALSVLWLCFVFNKRTIRSLSIFLIVLLVGVAWEIFEVLGGISTGQPNYMFDTSLDVLMDMTGGLCGLAIARWILLPRA